LKDIGIGLALIIAMVLGLKNKEEIKVLWKHLIEKIKEPSLYSNKWFKTVADETLDAEREKVRLAYCSSGDNGQKASELQNLLYRFDEEMNRRAWNGETPHAPNIHREHGWYLPNDD
jgi:hypothetical protein